MFWFFLLLFHISVTSEEQVTRASRILVFKDWTQPIWEGGGGTTQLTAHRLQELMKNSWKWSILFNKCFLLAASVSSVWHQRWEVHHRYRVDQEKNQEENQEKNRHVNTTRVVGCGSRRDFEKKSITTVGRSINQSQTLAMTNVEQRQLNVSKTLTWFESSFTARPEKLRFDQTLNQQSTAASDVTN